MINSFVSDRRRPVSPLLSSVDDTPMSHRHLKERSSIPSLLRHTDAFAITRVESSSGLADPITKVSSVPALLVSVSIKAVAIGDYQMWLDDKLVPTSYTPPFRSAVLDFDAQPKCLPGSAFDYVLFHVPRTGLDDIASLVAMLVQTDKFGTSVAQSLRIHSETVRTKRRQRAEEAAAKTGVKMVFPLVFCIFPAVWIVTIGPAAIKFIQIIGPMANK